MRDRPDRFRVAGARNPSFRPLCGTAIPRIYHVTSALLLRGYLAFDCVFSSSLLRRCADIISFNSDDPSYFGFSRFAPWQGAHFEKRLKAGDRLTDDVVGLAQHALKKPWSCAMLCVVDRVHNHTPNNFQARGIGVEFDWAFRLSPRVASPLKG